MKYMRPGFVLAAAVTLGGSLWLGYQLRFDFSVPADVKQVALLASLWVISLKLFCLWRFRQFRVLLKYFSISEFTSLFWALFTSSLFIYGISAHLGWAYAPPRSVVVADFGFSLLGLAGSSARPPPCAQPPRRRVARRAASAGAPRRRHRGRIGWRDFGAGVRQSQRAWFAGRGIL